ncbi:hypothetical protein KIW84_030862 [Lathyrus oleraceus]|uniref:Uncharacterized protein n=1 Tax=Pisum sativum TaxID=3888 RepID=A0A9D5AZV9_PEA|nr:hypothetical protein KIW84_030862 [Pisum sativum]
MFMFSQIKILTRFIKCLKMASCSSLNFHCFLTGGSSRSEFTPKHSTMAIVRSNMRGVSQKAENFLLDAVNMSLLERLNLAWKIIFPSVVVSKRSSNARIAKLRLQVQKVNIAIFGNIFSEIFRKYISEINLSIKLGFDLKTNELYALDASGDASPETGNIF